MALRQQQVLHSGVPDREQPIFTDPDGHVPHPDTFTRHLRKLYTAFLERTYCHPQNMAKREAANLMEDLLSPKNIYYQPFKFVLKGKKVG